MDGSPNRAERPSAPEGRRSLRDLGRTALEEAGDAKPSSGWTAFRRSGARPGGRSGRGPGHHRRIAGHGRWARGQARARGADQRHRAILAGLAREAHGPRRLLPVPLPAAGDLRAARHAHRTATARRAGNRRRTGAHEGGRSAATGDAAHRADAGGSAGARAVHRSRAHHGRWDPHGEGLRSAAGGSRLQVADGGAAAGHGQPPWRSTQRRGQHRAREHVLHRRRQRDGSRTRQHRAQPAVRLRARGGREDGRVRGTVRPRAGRDRERRDLLGDQRLRSQRLRVQPTRPLGLFATRGAGGGRTRARELRLRCARGRPGAPGPAVVLRGTQPPGRSGGSRGSRDPLVRRQDVGDAVRDQVDLAGGPRDQCRDVGARRSHGQGRGAHPGGRDQLDPEPGPAHGSDRVRWRDRFPARDHDADAHDPAAGHAGGAAFALLRPGSHGPGPVGARIQRLLHRRHR